MLNGTCMDIPRNTNSIADRSLVSDRTVFLGMRSNGRFSETVGDRLTRLPGLGYWGGGEACLPLPKPFFSGYLQFPYRVS